MDLLDEDVKSLEEERKGIKPSPNSTGTGRKRSLAGLNRFSAFSKANALAEKYRSKPEMDSTNINGLSKIEPVPKVPLSSVTGHSQSSKAEVKTAHRTNEQDTKDPLTKIASKEFVTNEIPTHNLEVDAILKFAAIEAEKGDSKQNDNQNRELVTKTGIKQSSNSHQLVTNQVPIGHPLVTETGTKSDTKSIGYHDYRHLSGNQKKIVYLVFSEMMKNGNMITGQMPIRIVAQYLNSTEGSVKTALFRLHEKGIVTKAGNKTGRGGWATYSIPEPIYRSIQNDELFFPDGEKRSPKVIPKVVPNASSSSSSLNSLKETKTTTTKQPLEGEWAEVQIPDILRSKQVSVGVIYQCRDQSLITAKGLQESLEAFAFDVLQNGIIEKKSIQNPQGFFMGAIRNGGYARPSNFMTDEEKAEKEMLERLETQNREREERRKRIFELSFQEWKEKLTPEEKQSLKPPFGQAKEGPLLDAWLKSHFQAKVFSGAPGSGLLSGKEQ